jgi:alanyl-tRNA synthetase
MTTKLFWRDAHLTDFTAQVLDCFEQAGHTVLVLDQTAFYPEGGGQPSDTGRLNEALVTHAETAPDGRILHHLQTHVSLQPGATVQGVVAWERRRELLQQHTGQHLLSQAFFQLFGAETKGFRILAEVSQIDLALDAPANDVPRALAQAEALTNQIIFENRPVRLHEVTPEQAAQLPLRKESFVSDCIRVVEIADFDWSPCGGTHAKQTGEVGLLAVRGWERAKQMVRVEFVCGSRLLRDYHVNNSITETLARQFTVGRTETPASVTRLMEENKILQRRSRQLAEVAARVEAEELFNRVGESNGQRIVVRTFTDRDFEEAKLLAHKLAAHPGVVALLAVVQAGAAKLVFARSANLTCDMNSLLRQACETLGGRGGGKPDFAQGGGSQVELLEEVLARAKAGILS